MERDGYFAVQMAGDGREGPFPLPATHAKTAPVHPINRDVREGLRQFRGHRRRKGKHESGFFVRTIRGSSNEREAERPVVPVAAGNAAKCHDPMCFIHVQRTVPRRRLAIQRPQP